MIGERAYNAILLGVLLWGLLVNVLLCAYASAVLRYIPPMALLIGYLVCAFVGVRIAARSRQPLVSCLGYNRVVVPFGAANRPRHDCASTFPRPSPRECRTAPLPLHPVPHRPAGPASIRCIRWQTRRLALR